MPAIQLFTIGFTQKSARTFFETLWEAGVQRLWDVRRNNVSQLAGFAKRDDLAYFARALCQIEYIHALELAPTAAMLEHYRRGGRDWNRYERQFLRLMRARKIEKIFAPERLDRGCLLCSEAKPDHCHRRLVAEYLQRACSTGIAITDLG